VGDFAVDTEVVGSDGEYRATLSSDWEIWGPNGGYVATIALRAAGAESRFSRPASFTGHFLSVAKFEEVDISVEVVRSTRIADSLLVRMSQGDKPVHIALVWTIDEIDGLQHDAAPVPDVPMPTELKSAEELHVMDDARPRFVFWENIEQRPLDWLDDWDEREPGDPRRRCWYRFRPCASFEDPYVDAARSLLLLDTLGWPAAIRAYAEPMEFLAPSLDISTQFHRLAPGSEWIYVEAVAPVGADGLVGTGGRAWSEDGLLLASAGAQLVCRPAQQIMPSG
jgi:acyl-CoA thioesterase II